MYRDQPATRRLDPEGAIQAMIFQQFLILLVLTPVAGAMSVAAYAVVGEKQARTLEPLLATPITTFELLVAKVLGALVPGIALVIICFALYLGGVALFAHPGVYRTLFFPRALLTIFLLGPLASLAALQLAVCVSSRVNDARSAQQVGALDHPADQRPARRRVHQRRAADESRGSPHLGVSCRAQRRDSWRSASGCSIASRS